MKSKNLSVVANPFAAPLDHLGRPCAAVRYDPTKSPHVSYIGAQRVAKVVEKRPAGGARSDREAVTWLFDVAPVSIEDTAYHRERIAAGELLPADAETAKRIGAKVFVDPNERLKVACAKRVVEWQRHHEELPPALGEWFSGGAPLVANWPAPPGSALAKERAARQPDAAPTKREPAKPAELSPAALDALGLSPAAKGDVK